MNNEIAEHNYEINHTIIWNYDSHHSETQFYKVLTWAVTEMDSSDLGSDCLTAVPRFNLRLTPCSELLLGSARAGVARGGWGRVRGPPPPLGTANESLQEPLEFSCMGCDARTARLPIAEHAEWDRD